MPARMASLSESVPGTSSQPSSVSAAPFSGLRTSARTSSPRSRSLRTTWPPMNPVPPVTKTLIRAKPIRLRQARVRRIAAGGARPTLGVSAANPPGPHSAKPTTAPVGQASRTAAHVSARCAIAVLPASPGDDDPLAELKELLRTAGVATAGELVQVRARPDPDRYLGRGKLAELKVGDRSQRRQPGRLRRRAGPAPGAEPRGGARRAGDRSHRRDPRHLRRPRAQRGGKAPGRAGPARVQPRAHARPVDPSRAARGRDRDPRPRGDPDRDRPPPGARPDREPAPPPRAPGAKPRGDAGAARRLGRSRSSPSPATRTRASRPS